MTSTSTEISHDGTKTPVPNHRTALIRPAMLTLITITVISVIPALAIDLFGHQPLAAVSRLVVAGLTLLTLLFLTVGVRAIAEHPSQHSWWQRIKLIGVIVLTVAIWYTMTHFTIFTDSQTMHEIVGRAASTSTDPLGR